MVNADLRYQRSWPLVSSPRVPMTCCGSPLSCGSPCRPRTGRAAICGTRSGGATPNASPPGPGSTSTPRRVMAWADPRDAWLTSGGTPRSTCICTAWTPTNRPKITRRCVAPPRRCRHQPPPRPQTASKPSRPSAHRFGSPVSPSPSAHPASCAGSRRQHARAGRTGHRLIPPTLVRHRCGPTSAVKAPYPQADEQPQHLFNVRFSLVPPGPRASSADLP